MNVQPTSGKTFIQRLLNKSSFPHFVGKLELLETHISWVILTGEFAYKIKKPIKFDFVDYSTLEQRKHFCELEVKLNRRFAPELYLGVVAIIESGRDLRVADKSEAPEKTGVVEYAVKMRQFSQGAIVASRLQNPALTSESVEDFGRYVANFHDTVELAIPTLDCVHASRIASDAADNFTIAKAKLNAGWRLETLNRLERWTSEQAEKLAPAFESRLRDGFVRRCHGDLHLKNIIQVDGNLMAFDGIEFNEAFQWGDVLSEIAFPVIDFYARGGPDFAWRLLNAYLESTGDYEGLDVLRFYLVYRAMVRVKVTCLNPKNFTTESHEQYAAADEQEPALAGPWDKYLIASKHFAFELSPKLAITHGFSGSGKSTVAMQIIEREGGIRVRSDVERHRLARKIKSSEEYSSDMNDKVYGHLLEVTDSVLKAGFPVVVDATFLSLKRRVPFLILAKEEKLGFQIIDCNASFDELCDRIRNRGSDPSEATIDVLKSQMNSHDPLTEEELQFVPANLISANVRTPASDGSDFSR